MQCRSRQVVHVSTLLRTVTITIAISYHHSQIFEQFGSKTLRTYNTSIIRKFLRVHITHSILTQHTLSSRFRSMRKRNSWKEMPSWHTEMLIKWFWTLQVINFPERFKFPWSLRGNLTLPSWNEPVRHGFCRVSTPRTIQTSLNPAEKSNSNWNKPI